MSIYKAQWSLRSLKTVLLRYSGIWMWIICFDILINYLCRFLAKCVLLLFPVNCYPGSYSDNKTQTCVLCNPGFYQDEEGKEECQPCPKNSSSVIIGSKSAADCKRKFVSSVSPSPEWIGLSSLTWPRNANVRKVSFLIHHCCQFTLPISLISRISFRWYHEFLLLPPSDKHSTAVSLQTFFLCWCISHSVDRSSVPEQGMNWLYFDNWLKFLGSIGERQPWAKHFSFTAGPLVLCSEKWFSFSNLQGWLLFYELRCRAMQEMPQGDVPGNGTTDPVPFMSIRDTHQRHRKYITGLLFM